MFASDGLTSCLRLLSVLLLLPSINRDCFLQQQLKPFAYFPALAGRASTQRHQESSQCPILGGLCLDLWEPSLWVQTHCRPFEVPVLQSSCSGFPRPSPKILGFSWCSLSSLSCKDSTCSYSLHLWDVLIFFFFTFSFVNNCIPSLTFFVNSPCWHYRYVSVSSMDFIRYRCLKSFKLNVSQDLSSKAWPLSAVFTLGSVIPTHSVVQAWI